MNGPQTPAVRSEERPFPPLTTIWYPIWTQIGKISFLESHNGGNHEHPPQPALGSYFDLVWHGTGRSPLIVGLGDVRLYSLESDCGRRTARVGPVSVFASKQLQRLMSLTFPSPHGHP